jgi:hypothetical protein
MVLHTVSSLGKEINAAQLIKQKATVGEKNIFNRNQYKILLVPYEED